MKYPSTSLPALACGGCMFVDARVCTLSGSVTSRRAVTGPLIVTLPARSGGAEANWRLVDHFVSAHAGRWKFNGLPGRLG